MNWDDLKIFDAAAASGSLSAAAKTLGLSQPQISRRLREFERELGARLFDRTPQGLRPTRAGVRLIPLAEHMRKAAEAVARAVPDLAGDRLSVVRISVDELREHFLTTHLQELQSAISNIELEIFSAHEHLDHQSRKTDIQIRSCLPDSETLIAKRVGQTGYGLYATREFIERHRNSASREAPLFAPWIGFSPDHLWYPLHQKWLEKTFQTPSLLRFNTMTAVANAVQYSNAQALLPHFLARRISSLVELLPPSPPPQTVEYLIVHRDLLREPAIRSAVDAITRLYKSHQHILRGD